MALPQAGDPVLSSDTTRMRYVKKTATQSVTSSTVLVDDNDLQATLPVGVWRVELWAHVSGNTSGRFKCTWAFSGTLGSTARTEFGPSINTTHSPATAAAATTVGVVRATGEAYNASGRYGTDNTPNFSAIHEDLYLEVTVAGLLKLQWAQDASFATSTNVSSASRLYITLIEPFA